MKVQALQTHAFTYGDSFYGSKRLRSAIAQFVNLHFHPHQAVKQEDVVATAGLTNSLEQMAYNLGDPGDGFLIGRPYYTSLPKDFGSRAGYASNYAYDLSTVAKGLAESSQLEWPSADWTRSA